MQLTLYLTACLTKYDLLVDPLVVTYLAKYQERLFANL